MCGFANAHRTAIRPMLKVLGNSCQINSFILDNGIGNAQHHVGVVGPITYFPPFAMMVLKDVAVMGNAIGIVQGHLFVCHAFCSQA